MVGFGEGRVGYWVNKQGKEVKISTMSTSYIENCLNLIYDRITKAINSYYDTDFEIPDDIQNKLDELEEELNKRYSK